ncbi:dTDP-4-dehydrorhamnose 3,5-epimerase family protein [Halovulum dunhuangense]|uniref:dTDP-4-dehydrorhamnose 3,5-epimerase n=1 Tax=Halovulum dunhuangense TaxID=1505036 RepID=A0A849L260_9RHOB|nr:dTDP-4-dehydrorhamnose 3,5-epimerase family protein [Halovulum dunhuangense]NNU80307.1 dTDP-4-dehydrorhamnose 3,5-epimerase family protein [Halovulum dunhuangense]
MKFTPLPLAGAWLIEMERIRDHRGFNARAWCAEEMAAHGLTTRIAQVNVIRNGPRGTIRGMHYQRPPFAETKLFRVTRGAIFDVIVDLRAGSPTRLQWISVELNAEDGRLLYVPEGFGQGFQTLADDTELTYQVSAPYSPAHGSGFRPDDPAFGIDWPLPVAAISDKDAGWPDFKAEVMA